METNPIYLEQRDRGGQSFGTTLSLIERLLRERLSTGYRSITVTASNSGSVVKFCFVVFRQGGDYQLMFQDIRNFRNWRGAGELGFEIANIENIIESFRVGSLSGVYRNDRIEQILQ